MSKPQILKASCQKERNQEDARKTNRNSVKYNVNAADGDTTTDVDELEGASQSKTPTTTRQLILGSILLY